jgi:hypothetical protein
VSISTTLLRQDLTSDLQDGFVSTLTGNGSTSLSYDTTKLPEFADGFLAGGWQKFTATAAGSAANFGLVRKVRNFTAANGELEALAVWPAATLSGDTYEWHRRFPPALKDLALVRALPLVYPDLYTPVEDRSILTVADTQVYSMAAITGLWDKPARVLLEESDGNLKPAKELMNWRVRRDGTVRYLEFPYSLPAGRTLRLELMTAIQAGATVAIDSREEPVLLAQAALWLYQNEWGRATGQAKEQLKADLDFWKGELAARKADLRMAPLKPTVHIPSSIKR